uniref:CLP1_P domain-containing protein n=1 Tax=Macrostomum lignano TaxID=282301 RepID=A0A1I8G5B5_9PLAT
MSSAQLEEPKVKRKKSLQSAEVVMDPPKIDAAQQERLETNEPKLTAMDTNCYKLEIANSEVSVLLFLESNVASSAATEDSIKDPIGVLFGCCQLSCLIGSVKILEFVIRRNKWRPVYSTENVSWLTVGIQFANLSTDKLDETDGTDESLTQLTKTVFDVLARNSKLFPSSQRLCAIACKPLKPAGYGEAFRKHHIFRYIFAPPKVQPSCLQLITESTSYSFYLSSIQSLRSISNEFRVHLPDDELWSGRLGEAVTECLDTNRHSREQQRFVVCGPRNSGKSSVARCLINRLLSEGVASVAYLDCDPGQTEFTPPGFVSLTLVQSPLLGPPFTHQVFGFGETACSEYDNADSSSNPRPSILAACCLGGCSPGSPRDYLSAVASLATAAADLDPATVPLVANTMGWTNGLGLLLLCETIRLLSPSYVVQIESESPNRNLPSLLTPGYLLSESAPRFRACQSDYPGGNAQVGHLLICVPGRLRSQPTRYGAPQQRELSVLATVLPLSNCPVYRVPFDAFVGVYISGGNSRINDSLDRVLNASLVGLCTADEDADLQASSGAPQRQLRRLNRLPSRHSCLGVGLVRCVDSNNRQVCLQTWTPSEHLARVRFLLHNIPDLPLPFLDKLQSSDRLAEEGESAAASQQQQQPPPYVGEMPDCGIGSLRLRAERRPLKHHHLQRR